ncbi:hypothetical protein CIB95_07580 [Lottiidibacillus patelloidae]|uniref:DUF4025 domain-containing protein n=1 Tax=Lottiidibacillus patelloidae TaxID=2670334 RepID=A0A263BVG2_9BACI|nr:hypothetical protein [Lottiidibacillus patelloidae]OZM57317.1 hypothetical protein CIB95_07580 [Lottiidibacillus patelloidae]
MNKDKSFLRDTFISEEKDVIKDTALNPQFSMAEQPFTTTEMYTGNSINEHTDMEEANLEIAKSEIGQNIENS